MLPVGPDTGARAGAVTGAVAGHLAEMRPEKGAMVSTNAGSEEAAPSQCHLSLDFYVVCGACKHI